VGEVAVGTLLAVSILRDEVLAELGLVKIGQILKLLLSCSNHRIGGLTLVKRKQAHIRPFVRHTRLSSLARRLSSKAQVADIRGQVAQILHSHELPYLIRQILSPVLDILLSSTFCHSSK
jgi:hypothetical protein